MGTVHRQKTCTMEVVARKRLHRKAVSIQLKSCCTTILFSSVVWSLFYNRRVCTVACPPVKTRVMLSWRGAILYASPIWARPFHITLVPERIIALQPPLRTKHGIFRFGKPTQQGHRAAFITAAQWFIQQAGIAGFSCMNKTRVDGDGSLSLTAIKAFFFPGTRQKRMKSTVLSLECLSPSLNPLT